MTPKKNLTYKKNIIFLKIFQKNFRKKSAKKSAKKIFKKNFQKKIFKKFSKKLCFFCMLKFLLGVIWVKTGGVGLTHGDKPIT